MRFHDSPPVIKSKKLSTKLFGLCSDESIISHKMILNRYLLFCVYSQYEKIAIKFLGKSSVICQDEKKTNSLFFPHFIKTKNIYLSPVDHTFEK